MGNYTAIYSEDDLTEASVDGIAKGIITFGKFIGLLVLGALIGMAVTWYRKVRR